MSGFSMITHTRPLSLQGRWKSLGLAAEQHPTLTSVEDHLNFATPNPSELYKVFAELMQTFGKMLGGGSFYLTSLYDSEGRLLDGTSTYKMNVPADTPAGDFWSAIAYSFATHGFIVGSERVGISSLEKDSLKVNDDGSVDLYFAPNAPAGQESNWIPAGEAFWVALRLYGPQPRLFDGSWKIEDIEKIK